MEHERTTRRSYTHNTSCVACRVSLVACRLSRVPPPVFRRRGDISVCLARTPPLARTHVLFPSLSSPACVTPQRVADRFSPLPRTQPSTFAAHASSSFVSSATAPFHFFPYPTSISNQQTSTLKNADEMQLHQFADYYYYYYFCIEKCMYIDMYISMFCFRWSRGGGLRAGGAGAGRGWTKDGGREKVEAEGEAGAVRVAAQSRPKSQSGRLSVPRGHVTEHMIQVSSRNRPPRRAPPRTLDLGDPRGTVAERGFCERASMLCCVFVYDSIDSNAA